MSPSFDLLAELGWRGMVQATSDGLAERLAAGPIRGYVGFDPTGPSLHVGHLVQTLLLTHLQRAGSTPVVVVGGGTGIIGDPSGRSAERNLLDDATIARNAANIRAQLERFLDFSPGPTGALLFDNREWLGRYGLLDFLRDVGKHFTLATMLAKDSVQGRLAQGVSFTEFSYMTLQATDFLHLWRDHDVELQLGGADQWGNITAGLELIRRTGGGEGTEAAETGRGGGAAEPLAYGLVSPLLLTPAGTKMGKSATGSIYLDPALTSPFTFYQYWINQPDVLLGQLLRWLTLKTADEVATLEAEQAARPDARPGQRALAFDLTARVHGIAEAELQGRVAEAAFSGRPIEEPDVLAELHAHAEGFEVTPEVAGGPILPLVVGAGLFASNGEARRQLNGGGLSVNGRRVASADEPVPAPLHGEWLVVRIGKRRVAVGRVVPTGAAGSRPGGRL
jgi:tyrosyl-tRNA synthetase